MEQKQKALLEIEARDEATQVLRDIKNSVDQLQGSMQQVKPTTGDFAKGFITSSIVMRAWNEVVWRSKDAIRGLWNMMDEGAHFKMMETAAETIAQKQGIALDTWEDWIDQLEEARVFGLAQAEVLKTMAFTGMGQVIEQTYGANEGMKKFIITMKDFAATAGVNSEEAVMQMVKAILTGRGILLEQFGLIDNLQRVYQEYGKTIGVDNVMQMTAAQKSQALLNYVMSEGSKVAEVYENTYQTAGKNLLSLESVMTAMRQELGGAFEPTLQRVTGSLLKWTQSAREWIVENSEVISKFIENLSYMFRFLGRDISNIAGDADEAGNKMQGLAIILGNFAKGIAVTASAIRILIDVLRVLAQVISINSQIFLAAMDGLVMFIEGVNAAAEQLKKGDFKGALRAIEGYADEFNNRMAGKFEHTTGLIEDAIGDISKHWDELGRVWATNVEEEWARAMEMAGSATKEWNENLQDLDTAIGDVADSVKNKIGKEMEDFADKIRKATEQFQERLQDMVIAHRERVKDLKEDLKREEREMDKSIKNVQENSKARIKELKERLSEQQALGERADAKQMERLQLAIRGEEEAEAAKIREIEDAHKDRVTEIRNELGDELAIQKRYAEDFKRLKNVQAQDDITRLKIEFGKQMKELRRQHKIRLEELRNEGVSEGASYGSGLLKGTTPFAQKAFKAANDAIVRSRKYIFDSLDEAQKIVLFKWNKRWQKFKMAFPFFQEGGVVPGIYNREVPIVAHAGEMVLNKSQQQNLFKMLQGNHGGGGVTVNVSGNTFDSSQRVDELVNKVVDIMANQNKLSRYNLI